mmetsp:Transcript_5056/g.8623  ORF Transcript_5056/g.8623 Transcript_5056/m.8623 type:complete len:175 (+) Transcript_5056:73-597(+)
MDISVGDELAGRIYMELYADVVPKTAENFRQFCTGEFRLGSTPKGYRDCKFHRIVKSFIVQGGDFLNSNGTGSMCIYRDPNSGKLLERFPDESEGLNLNHDRAGILSMANSGPNTNGSQFFITTMPCPTLDRKHVVFGKIVENLSEVGESASTPSLDVVRKIESVMTDQMDRPL